MNERLRDQVVTYERNITYLFYLLYGISEHWLKIVAIYSEKYFIWNHGDKQ